MQMPVLDGLAAIQDGSSGARDPRVPILALTAHALAEDRDLVFAAGVDGYIVKPVDMAELARAMDAVLTGGSKPA